MLHNECIICNIKCVIFNIICSHHISRLIAHLSVIIPAASVVSINRLQTITLSGLQSVPQTDTRFDFYDDFGKATFTTFNVVAIKA